MVVVVLVVLHVLVLAFLLLHVLVVLVVLHVAVRFLFALSALVLRCLH